MGQCKNRVELGHTTSRSKPTASADECGDNPISSCQAKNKRI